ncbi:hypothetical protein COR50_13925 [Chitinophaga caeni]|uniref:Uncharacterized protein n=1 Tax=Chitinophaga caeni TaxID=2029983 RepID=A0A291QWD8_9BACT|nr:hypothetical protein [Chitinophaga caeni]ATL48173.1 hypothetical protein COR50_13925 [Chitinophaga caeni]
MKITLQDAEREMTFIEYEMPALKSAEYTVKVTQETNQDPGTFSSSRKFAVTSERFSIDVNDIDSVFPQNLANGSFDKAVPHVLFNKKNLPWERFSIKNNDKAPWLAILLFDEGSQPKINKLQAKDLVPAGTTITVAGSSVTGTGTMANNIFSYPGLQQLSYGETPDESCNVIDIPLDLFNQVAPSAQDLPYLAHIRQMETLDKTDALANLLEDFALVIGNRLPQVDQPSYAYLVSLEDFGEYLPGNDGTNNIPAGKNTVRLLSYMNWSYTANHQDQSFTDLLEGLNKTADGKQELTVLQVPFHGESPSNEAVQLALTKQKSGSLSTTDATILAKNAVMMGYTPHGHSMRFGGHSVSWYRGPLTSFNIVNKLGFPVSCPDAVTGYNPETGMFDVSYGAAWQLGQLLALQNKSFSSELYNWKKSLYAYQVLEAEQSIIANKYKGINAFEHIFSRRITKMESTLDIPENIVEWMGRLSLLCGVPFNYLVPDERMLPPESLRFFYIDNCWIDALMDGAFSIGRATTASMTIEAPHLERLKMHARGKAAGFRLRKARVSDCNNVDGIITGCLLRSALLAGWPGLEIVGYSDKDAGNEICKLRMDRLSDEVIICIFNGDIQRVSLREPPESLHSGVDGEAPDYYTGLRVVQGEGTPGKGIEGARADIPTRNGTATLQMGIAAENMKTVLNAPPLNEGIEDFNSSQFALEMVKGAVKVDFVNDKS